MPKLKKVTPVVIVPLTKEVWDKVSKSYSSYGGFLSDNEFVKPLMYRYPNHWEKRRVTINIHNYPGWPHYFASVREDRNYFVGLERHYGTKKLMLIWKQPWCDIGKDWMYADLVSQGNKIQQLIDGRNFEGGERNSVKTAERWVGSILKKHFADKSLYEFRWDVDPLTKYYKEGD